MINRPVTLLWFSHVLPLTYVELNTCYCSFPVVMSFCLEKRKKLFSFAAERKNGFVYVHLYKKSQRVGVIRYKSETNTTTQRLFMFFVLYCSFPCSSLVGFA